MEMHDTEYIMKKSDFGFIIVKEVIEELAIKFSWDENEHILDIGCGPGRLSASILSDLAPPNARMIGGDISSSMVDFANKYCSGNRITFELMDVTDSDQLVKWKECFTTILCFATMQRIVDVKSAYKNMFELLKPGGKLLFFFPISHPLEKVFPILAKLPKYKEFLEKLHEMKINVTPREDHVSYTRNILKSIGFDLLVCKEKILEANIDSKDSLANLLRNSYPLARILPEDLLNTAVDDALKLVHEYKLLNKVGEGYKDPESILVVLAKKP